MSGANVGVAGLGGLSATTAADGTYAIPNVPAGTYVKVLAIGPGHDQAVTSLSVPGGGTINFSPALQRNWASVYGGAVVTASNGTEYTGNSCGPVAAVDQWQATGWSTNNGTDKFLVVRLPAVVNVTQFALDPGEACADGANTATGAYRVETSPDGTDWTVAHSGTFGTSARHVLNLVTPTAGASGVRFARLWLLSAQGGSGAPFRDFSEFGVYGTAVGADTTPPETTLDPGGPPVVLVQFEAGATFECRSVRRAFAACTSPHNVGRAGGWRRTRSRSERETRRATSTRPGDPDVHDRYDTAGDDARGGRSAVIVLSASRAQRSSVASMRRVRGVHLAILRRARWRTATYTFAVRATRRGRQCGPDARRRGRSRSTRPRRRPRSTAGGRRSRSRQRGGCDV